VIPHSRPSIDQSDIEAVVAVVSSGMLAAGERTASFEKAVGDYLGLPAASALSSGTAALYCTLAALGVGDGDEVVIPAYVCSSLLYAVRMTGARPVVADSGDDPFHADAETVKRVLSPRTRAVIVAHMFGATAPIDDIVCLGVPVVEDIAQSIGAMRGGVKAGALGSTAAVASFYATKVIAAGEGGMVMSGDAALCGVVADMARYADKTDGAMRFNFAMTDMAAALGMSQLSRIETMIERRIGLAVRYGDAFSSCGVSLPAVGPDERHIFFRYVIRTEAAAALREALHRHGVRAEHPVFAPLSRYPGVDQSCPRAEEAWRTALSLPLYPAMTDTEADAVIEHTLESLHDIDREM